MKSIGWWWLWNGFPLFSHEMQWSKSWHISIVCRVRGANTIGYSSYLFSSTWLPDISDILCQVEVVFWCHRWNLAILELFRHNAALSHAPYMICAMGLWQLTTWNQFCLKHPGHDCCKSGSWCNKCNACFQCCDLSHSLAESADETADWYMEDSVPTWRCAAQRRLSTKTLLASRFFSRTAWNFKVAAKDSLLKAQWSSRWGANRTLRHLEADKKGSGWRAFPRSCQQAFRDPIRQLCCLCCRPSVWLSETARATRASNSSIGLQRSILARLATQQKVH